MWRELLMTTWDKFISAIFLVTTSCILCLDFLIVTPSYFLSLLHCVCEGIIVLIFYKDLRRENY